MFIDVVHMQGRRHEWLFSSTEGQWQVVESAKTNRLIMVRSHLIQVHMSHISRPFFSEQNLFAFLQVFLDTDFFSGSMEIIQVMT